MLCVHYGVKAPNAQLTKWPAHLHMQDHSYLPLCDNITRTCARAAEANTVELMLPHVRIFSKVKFELSAVCNVVSTLSSISVYLWITESDYLSLSETSREMYIFPFSFTRSRYYFQCFVVTNAELPIVQCCLLGKGGGGGGHFYNYSRVCLSKNTRWRSAFTHIDRYIIPYHKPIDIL